MSSYLSDQIASSLSALDVSLFVLTLTISVLIGLYFANKNGTLEEYMLGGRDQRLLPVAMSMMTSFVSGLTLVCNPVEIYNHGAKFAFFSGAQLLSVPVSAFVLLPVFHRLGSVSVFSYLELRYSVAVKRIVSLLFIIQMCFYNAVVLYVPSLSLKSVLGISESVSIGAVGLSCLIYCTLGGIKAVIWTDFFQAFLMYLSLFCICVGGTIDVGGLSNLLSTNVAGGRLSMAGILELDLSSRHTVFTMATGGLLLNLYMNGANQIQIQRALSLPSLRLAQWSLVLTAIFTMLICSSAGYAGLVLYAHYADCDPFESGQIDKRDALLIYYVANHRQHLPGMRGLFVAGIFAATLSTLSSFQNSMSALLIEDFIRPSLSRPLSDRRATQLSKLLAPLFGAGCIGLTFVVGRIAGLLQASLTLFGALGGPFLAAFCLGMLTRFINSVGILTGMMAGFAFSLYVQLYQTFYLPPLAPSLPLSVAHCATNSSSIVLMTSSANHAANYTADPQTVAFDIRLMSYLWLPVASMLLTSLLAALVSLASGGLSQQVDDKYLAGWLHRPGQPYCNADQKSQLVSEMRVCVSEMAQAQKQRSSKV